ncbi:MAG: dihydrofolate reductase family protein [Terriglobales bacterium]
MSTLLQTLWEERQTGTCLSPVLRRLYDGDLGFPPRPRPYVYANFVASTDGVVSYGIPGRAGGGTISGGDAGDRFVMALLRMSADAVIVGATTLREAGPKAVWDPARMFPPAGAAMRRWRRQQGMPGVPLLVVVSASGRVPAHYAALSGPESRALVVTSKEGVALLGHRVPAVALAPAGRRIPVAAVLGLLREKYGVRRLLHEGGPSLLGEFVRAGALQELFLTMAPTLAGRDENSPRPGLIAGTAFLPRDAPQLQLRSVKAHGSMLFLRYRSAQQN